ncbi:MAG TPA: hypothetical protein EYG89_01485, partial [Bacteroidia bacterium]|nr:hypothetical protein [Bacteroidia bacterium]
MKIFKIKKIVIAISILFAINSCTKEVIINENCDYTFNTAVESNGQAPVDTLETITIDITDESVNCNTNYMMYFTTTRDGISTDDGNLVYQGTEKYQNQTNAFEIITGIFPVQFTTDVPGNYEITFYITNPNASNPIQSQSVDIEFIDSDLTINMVSLDDNIFVLDDASYTFEINGGSGNYEVSVNPSGANLSSSLKINTSSTSWGTEVNTGSNVNLLITPTELGTTTFSVNVHDIDFDVYRTFTINLISTIPVFALENVYLISNNIWSDETTEIHVEVNTNGYNH